MSDQGSPGGPGQPGELGYPPDGGWPSDGGYLPPGDIVAPGGPRRRGKGAMLVSGALAVMLIATLVLVAVVRSRHNEANRAAGIVPADAIAFASVSLDPSLLQKKDLFQVAQKFPKARAQIQGSFDQAKDSLLTDALKSVCLDYRKDVKPWLGSELAVALLPGSPRPQPVVLIRVNDEVQARRALEVATKRSCRQTSSDTSGPAKAPAYRIANGFAVISSSASTGAMDAVASQAAKHDGGLAKAARFTAAVNQLHADRLAFGWVDVASLTQLAKSSVGGFKLPASCGIIGPGALTGTAAFSFFATPNTLSLEGISLGGASSGRGGPAALTEGLPADSSAALTVFNVGGIASRALDCFGASSGGANGAVKRFADQSGLDVQADVLSWMHGEALVVAGPKQGRGTLPSFALVVAPSDQAKAAAGLVKIRKVLSDQGHTMSPRSVGGVQAYVGDPSANSGVQLAMALMPGRFMLASSPEYLAKLVAHPGTLGSTDDYRSVIGSGGANSDTVQLVVRVAPVSEAIVANLHASAADRYRRDVAPYLAPFKAIGLRSWRDGTTGHVQVTIAFN
jgi:hypothetical protein